MANFIGFDGDITVGAVDTVQVKTWRATFSAVVNDVGGFGQAGRYRRLGKKDLQGSFGGVGKHGSTNPITAHLVTGTVATIVLKFYEGSGTSDSQVTFDAVVSEVELGSTHDGDQTVTANFMLSSTVVTANTPWTLSWLSS